MTVTAPSVPPDSVEQRVVAVRAAQRAGHHADALTAAVALAAEYLENRDALLLVAHSQRHLGRIDDAFATLDRLAAAHPTFSRLHEERGLCHVARKEAAPAIAALRRSVVLNPALPMAWRMLDGLHRLTGDPACADAATNSAALAALPSEIVAATAFYFDGELDPAESAIRAFLLHHGDHPEAMRLLAKVGVARDVLDDAETLFAAVVTALPDHRRVRFEYADCLLQRHKNAAAREQVSILLADEPANADYRLLLATASVGLGDQATAIAVYREMLAANPGASDVNLWLGHALKTVGDVPGSIAAYRAAVAARPAFGDAYWSLANLKTYRFTNAEIAAMRAQETAPEIAADDRLHLCFALGKAYEDRGAFVESWAFYARGNAIKRSGSGYQAGILEGNTVRQIAVCTPAFFASRAGYGDPRSDPIFIVGLPRAGSTLVEQILASHSAVEGTQELADIPTMVIELQGREYTTDAPRYPGVLADMTAEQFAALGARYLADTRVYRSGKPFFIDKMPNNFRHIGLIHLMLPNARIIDARREPMACCFSNLKQLFAQGQEFAYSIDDMARYYRTYVELMAHWDAVLPGRVLRVQHDDVIADLEGSVRRILDYCGLPFEQACVEFHKSKRSVRTPSAEQVRQPIFRDGLDQWRNYEPWLGELKAALAPLDASASSVIADRYPPSVPTST